MFSLYSLLKTHFIYPLYSFLLFEYIIILDTSNQDYPIPLKISQTVTIKEIKDAIQKLPIGKVVGPDRILNKAIKAALKVLTTPLANTVTTCLLKGKLLECCKITTIIVLQKANKKDYFLLKSY